GGNAGLKVLSAPDCHSGSGRLLACADEHGVPSPAAALVTVDRHLSRHLDLPQLDGRPSIDLEVHLRLRPRRDTRRTGHPPDAALHGPSLSKRLPSRALRYATVVLPGVRRSQANARRGVVLSGGALFFALCTLPL